MAGAWVLALSPVQALAQSELDLGSRIAVSRGELKQKEVQRVLAEFATCVIDKRRALASAFILDRSIFRFDEKYGRLADGFCLEPTNALAPGITMKLDDEAMRYALAEAILQDEIANIDPAKLSSAPPIATPMVYDYSAVAKARDSKVDEKAVDEMRAAALAKVIMYKFGDCTVRSAPLEVREFLQSAPGTSAEGAAIRALNPALGSCLEKGAQVTLNRTRLRGALAVSYYSLAHAPPSATSYR